MDSVALTIAVITYAGVAIGGVPGLALDRTGIALLGAIAMVAVGRTLHIRSGHVDRCSDDPASLCAYGHLFPVQAWRVLYLGGGEDHGLHEQARRGSFSL